MPLLIACNRVGGKESDLSKRTARHWLYVKDRKKKLLDPENVHSSILHLLFLLLLLPVSSRIFLPLSLFAPFFFVLSWSCVTFLFALHRCQVYWYGRALNYWCPTARRETTKKERRRWTSTDPVISEKSFPRHSVRHRSFRSFSLSSARLLFCVLNKQGKLEPALFKRKEELWDETHIVRKFCAIWGTIVRFVLRDKWHNLTVTLFWSWLLFEKLILVSSFMLLHEKLIWIIATSWEELLLDKCCLFLVFSIVVVKKVLS